MTYLGPKYDIARQRFTRHTIVAFWGKTKCREVIENKNYLENISPTELEVCSLLYLFVF
jgi:hypothetical protein